MHLGINGDVSKQEVMVWLIRLLREQRAHAARHESTMITNVVERAKVATLSGVVARFAEDFCLPPFKDEPEVDPGTMGKSS